MSLLRRYVWRAGYEVWRRSGAALVEPAPAPWPDTSRAPTRAAWLAWLATERRGRWWTQTRESVASGAMGEALCSLWGASERAAVLERAERAGRGELRGFGHLWMARGWPVDWHSTARRGVRWSDTIHHTRALDEMTRCGDVKRVWELDRSPQVFDWVRATAVTGDQAHGERLGEYIASFEAQCPWRCGVHWASGQEVALRALVWLWGAALLEIGEAGWRALTRVMLASGHHLARHLDFARRAVPNNHVLSEALGLWVIGSLCGWDEAAAEWQRVGRAVFLEACRAQHLADGGYCQSSHTYHRLALHLLLWAHRLFGDEDGELDTLTRDIIDRAGPYLLSMMDEVSGEMSNFGAVDGSLLNPWTECAYGDMRPVLGALDGLRGEAPAWGRGLWEEEAWWFAGRPLDARPAARRSATSARWSASGLMVHRVDGRTFGVLRAGRQVLPFGQGDMGHVSLWYGGREIFIDSGSYSYNEDLHYHEYLHTTLAHSSPRVVGADGGYKRLGRWSWVAAPELECWWEDGAMVARWGADGASWERRVEATATGWRVVDRGRGLRGRAVRIGWLLDGVGWAMEGGECVERETGHRVRVEAWSCVAKLSCVKGLDNGRAVAGWRSRRYLEREAATVLEVDARGGDALELVTELITKKSHEDSFNSSILPSI